MEISVVKKEELKHEYKVKIPAATIDQQLQQRLIEVGKDAKIPGFRPGKIPMNILRQKFGSRVMTDVLETLVQRGTAKTLVEQNIRAATQPQVKIQNFDEGKGLEFLMTVELMPEIALIDFSALALTRPVAEVTRKEIDEALQRFASQFRDYTPIEEKRPAVDGDIVVIDFVGTIDGKEFDGGKGEKVPLKLGGARFLPDFEAGIPGMKAGETKNINVNFPADYQGKDVAGKKAVFSITLTEIRKEVQPPVDDALAKRAGFDEVTALEGAIREHIEEEFRMASRMKAKRVLLDALDEAYDFEIPESLYKQEFDSILAQYKKSQGHQHTHDDACHDEHCDNPDHHHAQEAAVDQDNTAKKDFKLDDKTRKEFEDLAARRVRLGLVLAHVSQEQKIFVNDDELRQAVIAEARRFPGQEKKVIDFYRKNPQMASGLSAPILEDKVVDYILGLAKITDQKVSAEQLFADDAAADAAAPAKKQPKSSKSKK